MEKVSKHQICYKLSSNLAIFLPIILVFVLFLFSFSFLTTLVSLLSTMFFVTLTRKKGSPDENIHVQKFESQPSLGDALDSERCSFSIMETSLEEVNADPHSGSDSDSDSSLASNKSEGFENDHHSRTQDLGLEFANDVDDEDSLIEIKLPSSHFLGSMFKHQGLMDEDDDENLIEIDISM